MIVARWESYVNLNQLQTEVDRWIVDSGGYWNKFQILAHLTEELGEVSAALQTEAASRAAIDTVIERDILPATDPRERDAVHAKLVADTLAYLALAEARQAAFFRRIGVDERITRIGLDHPAVTDFWFLSVPAMARFGIERVVAPSNYAATDTRRFGPGKVVYIEPVGSEP